jgi:putative mycofactocin binding protein MftB
VSTSSAVPARPLHRDAGDHGAVPAGQHRARFDLDAPWQLAAQVRLRPEAFGALLYHFGTRQLSFLKSPALVAVVTSLGTQPSARAACQAAGVQAGDMVHYANALQTLAASRMICQRAGA